MKFYIQKMNVRSIVVQDPDGYKLQVVEKGE